MKSLQQRCGGGPGGAWSLSAAACAGLCSVFAMGPGVASADPVAFVNARLIPIEGPEIERGYLVVDEGKITAIGAGELAGVGGEGIEVRDCAGLTIMPGLVDTHSHLGGVGGADGAGPFQPGVEVRDSLNVRSSDFRRALAGGLTTLNIMPGSGHLSSGRTVYVKLRWFDEGGAKGTPETVDSITIVDDAGRPMGGLKMANGTNSLRAGGGAWPGTRGKSAFIVREQYIKAQEYGRKLAQHRAKVEAGEATEAEAPSRDLHLETLLECMAGTRIVHHHTHRSDDVISVLRLAEEFGLRIVLHHVSEAWMVADEIAAFRGVDGPDGEPWGAPCSIILVDAPGGKLEAVNLVAKTGGVLERAGASVAFHTDDWITESRLFLRSAALAVRAGMSREAALRGLTIEGARMLDLADRVGSLEVGKDADFVLLTGDPLSVYTKVLETWVEGHLAFDRTDPEDLLYAQGGYGLGRDVEPYFCCYDELMKRSRQGDVHYRAMTGESRNGGGQ